MIKCKKERIKLRHLFYNFIRFYALFVAVFFASDVCAAQMQNPRSVVANSAASHRATGNVGVRTDVDDSATSARSAARKNVAVRAATTPRSARSAANVSANAVGRNVRSATLERAGLNNSRRVGAVSNAGLARSASVARATAVFNDVSKIGGGYVKCRDAYATCMDQFCANANDKYRRCYCSPKFIDFRNTEDALDEAKLLLMRFEDDNLNAVDKTAAEVDAMYSATVGEAAIKNDTSAAQNILNEISDLLSGKKKTNDTAKDLGIISVDFTADVDDIWGGDGASIFDTGTGVDLTSLEGQDLFNASNKQCLQLIAEQCENDATLNMATSAYGIMITQDCNAYEKSLNSKREGVMQTVRQAEKILREARLEEYRAHNSADVNECITKVKTALTADVACGANYKRCLDYTGKYVNGTTGEVMYDPSLFKLTEQIVLTGGADVVADNPNFDKFLDEKKKFATTALGTCRDIADTVWSEFKRSAIIEIAQAQAGLIEETKMSCVSTIAECYDTQTNALKNTDKKTANVAGALSVYAAKSMCEERVTRCAALYDGAQCKFDSQTGKLTSRCGLTALLEFVDTVDDARIADGCIVAIDNYVRDLCTPDAGDKGYPWKCRNKMLGKITDAADVRSSESLAANIKYYAVENCSDPTKEVKTYEALPLETRLQVERSIESVFEELSYQLMETCETLDGYWVDADDYTGEKELTAFYTSVFGGDVNDLTKSAGVCVENSTRVKCLSYNVPDQEPVATYDATRGQCVFTSVWYERQCSNIGGYYADGVCYMDSGD